MDDKAKPKGSRVLYICLILAALILALTAAYQSAGAIPTVSGTEKHTLVIDPGHGGFDGGAVSDDGSKESDINLAIGLKIKNLADLIGQKNVMTRMDDSFLTEYAEYSEHQDLERRTALMNETPGAITFSIHQNDFPTGQPSGAQVLYSSYEGSEVLGKLIHANLIQYLDPKNRRVAEPAPKSLFITANANCPAVLIECGFMSNNFDVLKLCDDHYQTALSVIILASLTQYLNGSEKS